MSREVPVRFCEGLGVKFPRPAHSYIPMAHGFTYLVAIIDLHSRFVFSWRLSNTMDTSFCLEALEEALERFGKPEISTPTRGRNSPQMRLQAVYGSMA